MSENDYIAEYVKEKHPRLLGIDYSLWKISKEISATVSSIIDGLTEAFRMTDPEDDDIADIRKKIKESGEEYSDEISEITYEGECYNAERHADNI